jgi:replicative DNA helicase
MDAARRYRDKSRRDYSRDGGSRERGESQHGGPRSAPHSTEAEESVLGSVLLDNQAINVCLEQIRAEDFYKSSYQTVFEAMVALTDRHEPIDPVTLGEQLRSMGQLEAIGGPQTLSFLASSVPNAANVSYYARVIKEMAIRRRLIHESTDIINSAYEMEGCIEDFIDTTEQRILGVSDLRTGAAFHKVSEIVQDSISLVEKLYDQKEPVTGVPSGLSKLDRMTAGFQPSDLVIVAARPSMGKTALVLGMAQYVGIYVRKPVAFFSLEMSKEQLVLRMLCSESRINNSNVRTGNLTERDFARIVDGASRISESDIFIDDTPALTITELRAKARRLAREHSLGLVVVDYLQLLRSPAYSNSREQEISDISRSLKALAKELNVPVVALSQLNRSVESRNDKRPMMSDLRESGAIEQDADIIMFIYRDEVYNKESPDKGVAELIISKQRTGPTGAVRVAFSGEYTRFDNLDETDMPVEVSEAGGLDF